jgi:hypothetical protein
LNGCGLGVTKFSNGLHDLLAQVEGSKISCHLFLLLFTSLRTPGVKQSPHNEGDCFARYYSLTMTVYVECSDNSVFTTFLPIKPRFSAWLAQEKSPTQLSSGVRMEQSKQFPKCELPSGSDESITQFRMTETKC